MAASKTVKSILDDMNKTISELQQKNLLRDSRGISTKDIGKNLCEISFAGKNHMGSIVFDKHITSGQMINTLLEELQYNILLYDKAFIQAEFTVKENEVIKERLVFMKKHNKIWDAEEIAATHLTISNHETCRIPMKGIVTFSEFVRFILFHFYGIKLDLKVCRSNADDTITEKERKMIHMNWN